MFVENKSKDTKLTAETLKEIKDPVAKNYKSSKEDEKIIWFIKERKNSMQQKRSVVDKYWKQFIKQFEALFVPYTDGRASSNVPLERSIIELFVAEAIKRPTNFNFTGAVWFEFQERILEKVWKHDWGVNNRDSEILNNEYLTAIFGTSIIFTWYERSYRVISDFDGEDEDGKIKFQRKLQTKGDILLKNIDIRDFYVDERAKKMKDAVDCIYETYLTYEEFLDYSLDKSYDQEKLDAIVPTQSRYNSNRPFIVQEERGEGESKFVKITKYWNTKLDMYREVANDSVLIKSHPILNASHCLPFVVRQYGKNPFSIYGKGLCEILVTFKSDINKLREMLMEAIKRSNQEVIAIWGWLNFDGNQFAYNNQFMKFKGNLQWNFQQLSWTPPNQAIFTRLQELFKEVAIFCGIDIMNILWEPQQTAYQTAVQKESSLQRVNVVLKNRDEAFEELANQHKDNLQMFYPLKLVRKLQNINDKNEPKEEMDKEYPSIEVPKMKGKRFMETNEKEIFEVSPETIRWDVKIEVSTDLNAPTITEVEKAQRMEFYNGIANLTNAYAADPELWQIIPKKKAILDLAKLNNIDTEKSDDMEVQEQKKELYKELQTMMKGTRTPAIAPNQEQNLVSEEEKGAMVSQDGQVPELANVTTPKI